MLFVTIDFFDSTNDGLAKLFRKSSLESGSESTKCNENFDFVIFAEIYYIPSQGFGHRIELGTELGIMMEERHYKKDFITMSYNTFKIEIYDILYNATTINYNL